MNFDFSPRSKNLLEKLESFMAENILPLEQHYREFCENNPWTVYPALEELKTKAREQGLWNLFLPESYGEYSPGLSNLEYAPLAECMGRILWSSQVFNCSAPDSGNMEILARYGNAQQKKDYLEPLLSGSIRSAFLMTEPSVASSDARNIECRITRHKDHYLVNGHKWWSTGALNPNTSFFIVMGKTDPSADAYRQQSMIIVPKESPGVKILRPLKVFGYSESPEGHAEIMLENVKLPIGNIILAEGSGFEIAQGRLGPGRIHHCMRLIGTAQRALEMMVERVKNREAFGQKLSNFGTIKNWIALSACEIEQARLLCHKAAYRIDKENIKSAKEHIAMIKIVVPSMACRIIDRSIQAHGGLGVCQDTPLAEFWTYARALRLADGPDEVHIEQLGRNIIKRSKNDISDR